MRFLNMARHWLWIAPLVLGVVFIGGGLYMASEGREAKDEVRDALVRENIVTSEDATIPNVLVDDADTAKSEAEIIEAHTREITGGETYATLDRYISADGEGTTSNRDEALIGPDGNPVPNPARNTAFQSASLRTSLNLAVMGFKVSDLVIGMGFFMIAVGATFILFLAPAVYWASEVANERAAQTEKAATLRRQAKPTA